MRRNGYFNLFPHPDEFNRFFPFKIRGKQKHLLQSGDRGKFHPQLYFFANNFNWGISLTGAPPIYCVCAVLYQGRYVQSGRKLPVRFASHFEASDKTVFLDGWKRDD